MGEPEPLDTILHTAPDGAQVVEIPSQLPAHIHVGFDLWDEAGDMLLRWGYAVEHDGDSHIGLSLVGDNDFAARLAKTHPDARANN